MIPTTSLKLNNVVVKQNPTIQYRLDETTKRIIGTCDGIEALKQTIFNTLQTDRYAFVIHSWEYGSEVSSLIGEPINYVEAECERMIKEALEGDDRILAVDTFEFSRPKHGVLAVSFVVHSVYGEIDETIDVEV